MRVTSWGTESLSLRRAAKLLPLRRRVGPAVIWRRILLRHLTCESTWHLTSPAGTDPCRCVIFCAQLPALGCLAFLVLCFSCGGADGRPCCGTHAFVLACLRTADCDCVHARAPPPPPSFPRLLQRVREDKVCGLWLVRAVRFATVGWLAVVVLMVGLQPSDQVFLTVGLQPRDKISTCS
jgi:hypothetical protein